MLEQGLSHRTDRRTRGWIPLSLLLLLGSASAAAAVRVQVLNFSPRNDTTGGQLSFDLGGQAQVSGLPYKGHSEFITLANPSFEIKIRDEQGTLLVSRQLTLIDGRDHVIGAAGDGTRRPFTTFQSMQHAEITPDGSISVQIDYLATNGSFTDPLQRIRFIDPCSQPSQVYAPGFLNPTPRDDGYGAGLNFGTAPAGECVRVEQVVAHVDGRQERLSIEFAASAGERIRVFSTGDGNLQPYEQVVVRYGIEPTLPTVTATAKMEGLWYDPERPGEGLAVLYDPTAPPPRQRTRVMFYGFDGDSRSVWATNLTGGTVVLESFLGGSPNGQQTTATEFLTSIVLRFHSCREASFVTNSPSRLIRHTDADRLRARRLVKLLPLENCDA